MSVAELAWKAYLIAQWIALSSTIILFNKWLLSEKNFHFPLTLVLLHMAFMSVACRAWKALGWAEVPSLSWEVTLKTFVPIAAFFAASLGFGNAAYLYLSVAFVQMLKASTSVAVLLVSFALKLEAPNATLGLYIVAIASGVGWACAAQVGELSVLGVAVQMLAVIAEALRLCTVQISLTSRGLKLSPVAFLYYVAPLCALVLVPPWLATEAALVTKHHAAPMRRVGVLLLLLNASVAFLLNLATMALIKSTSALTLNVSGVAKDLLLIGWSVVVSGALVTPSQMAGYCVALAGVSGYTRYKRQQAARKAAAEAAASEFADADDDGSPLSGSADPHGAGPGGYSALGKA